MRSTILQKIIDETPQEVKDKVKDYADLVDRVYTKAIQSERDRLREIVKMELNQQRSELKAG